MVGRVGTCVPGLRVAGSSCWLLPGPPDHTATRTGIPQCSWFQQRSLLLSLVQPEETEHWTKSSLERVQNERSLGEQGNRDFASMPGAVHLAVCYTDPAAATEQFFLTAKYICGNLTSDRDNEVFLLTSLDAQNSLGSRWFQGVGMT